MSSSLKRSNVSLSNRSRSGFFASVSSLLGLNARAQRRRSQNTQHRNLTRQNNLDLTEDNVHPYRCLHGSQSQYQGIANDSNFASYGQARTGREGYTTITYIAYTFCFLNFIQLIVSNMTTCKGINSCK